MTEEEARAAVHAAIGEIAPEVAPEDLVDDARLRQDLELDSLDFLRVLEVVARTTGVDVPEEAYGEVATVGGLVGHVLGHVTAPG